LDRNRAVIPDWWKMAIKVWEAISEPADK